MVKRNAKGVPTEWAKYYMMHWEIWPILAIAGGMGLMYVFTSVYMLYSRPDVDWYRGQHTTQFVRDLTQPKVNKLFIYFEEFPPNNELADLYRSMEKKEKECKTK